MRRISSRFWTTLFKSLDCFSACSRRCRKDSISSELLGGPIAAAAEEPAGVGETPLRPPRKNPDGSTTVKLLVSGRFLARSCGTEEPADNPDLEGLGCEDCGVTETRPVAGRASSIRSSRSVSTRPFDNNTRYPDCEIFGSVYHAVILAVTRTRVSSWPFATTWTAHS